MMWAYKALTTVLLGLALVACSKTPSTPSSVSSAPASAPVVEAKLPQRMQFKDLEQFKGKPPWDLVKDEVIGKEIKAIVPQSQFKCMDDIFNYMHDLEMQRDGSVQASMNGSHADQFMEAFISASPDGSLNVVLNCNPQSTPKGTYQLFANSAPGSIPPKELIEWFYIVGRDSDKIAKSDGKGVIEVAFTDFVKSVLPEEKPATMPSATAGHGKSSQPVPVPKEPSISAASSKGEWECKSTSSEVAAQAFFLFKDRLFVYSLGTSLKMVSLDFETTGAQGRGRFNEMNRNGKTVEVSVPYEVFVSSASSGKLTFDMKIAGAKGDVLSRNECVPLRAAVNQAPVQSRAPKQSSGADLVAAYANKLASEIERASYPACGAIASNIRMVGNSGAPEYVRMRQVEAMLDKVPRICFP